MLKTVLYGTLAYMVAVFPLAFVWHLVIFKDRFRAIGYLGRDEPLVGLGFATIVIQGVILSTVLTTSRGSGSALVDPFRICVPLMALIWTAQVLAHAAKFEIQLGPFIVIESAYFLLKAVLVSLAMAAALALAR